jgi:hypothetical protein
LYFQKKGKSGTGVVGETGTQKEEERNRYVCSSGRKAGEERQKTVSLKAEERKFKNIQKTEHK